jgi:putative colanic acid biosynthesis acetyltransferase WcaF
MSGERPTLLLPQRSTNNFFMEHPATDLSTFSNKWYSPGRPFPVRALWYVCNQLFFKSSFPFYSPKRILLRLFGARVGRGLIIKPYVSIKYPWKLVIGDHVWIGEDVWIDNLAKVTLGSHSCLSQGALLLCGNHNYKKTTFDLIVSEITLEQGAWAGARSTVCGGSTMGSHSLLTVGSVAIGPLEPNWMYQGNPARKLRPRIINP